MKFTPEGFVSMASDATLPGTPKSSKYEIKWGQGTLLSFTTKNYLHELSDAKKGIPGVGFAGDFEFVYFGKEGNKLKFRTQRKKTEQFVYFEPATAQDWADIETLSKNINTLEENSDKYYFKVENNGLFLTPIPLYEQLFRPVKQVLLLTLLSLYKVRPLQN